MKEGAETEEGRPGDADSLSLRVRRTPTIGLCRQQKNIGDGSAWIRIQQQNIQIKDTGQVPHLGLQ